MKKNEFIKCAAAGLFACFCISGQTAREVTPDAAVTKSEKTNEAVAEQPAETVQEVRSKGAAKRVVEGVSAETSVRNGVRKSAAQMAIDAEIELSSR